jgi:hypothetical protein
MRRLLHGTMVGRFVTDLFWKILSSDVLALVGFDAHPETKKLKSSIDAMFTGASFSILNYDSDPLDFVRSGQIKIHVAEVDHLEPGMVHLSDGTSFASDAILVQSGWKKVPPLKFLPEGLDAELGLPHKHTALSEGGDLGSNKTLLQKADEEILSQFPRLLDQPRALSNYAPPQSLPGGEEETSNVESYKLTPFMLYRFMVPPTCRFLESRDIAFCGLVTNFSTPISAHLQSLWIAAFFAGSLDTNAGLDFSKPGALETLRYQTVLNNRYGKWRYPADWGENKAPSFIFDAVPYFDMLLRDLGLPFKRKAGILSDLLQPYGPEDYQGTTVEWMAKYRSAIERRVQ